MIRANSLGSPRVFLATHRKKLRKGRDSLGKPQIPANTHDGALRNRALRLDFMERPQSRYHVPPTGVGASSIGTRYIANFGLSWYSSVPDHAHENKIQYRLDAEPQEKVQRFLPMPSTTQHGRLGLIKIGKRQLDLRMGSFGKGTMTCSGPRKTVPKGPDEGMR